MRSYLASSTLPLLNSHTGVSGQKKSIINVTTGTTIGIPNAILHGNRAPVHKISFKFYLESGPKMTRTWS